MHTYANQPEPAGFADIRKAFDTALGLPQWQPACIKVGICRADGGLAATGVLHDRRQARLFAIHMEALGYCAHAAQAGEPLRDGCDVLYRPGGWTARQAMAEEATALA
jgi:hypothetical protein